MTHSSGSKILLQFSVNFISTKYTMGNKAALVGKLNKNSLEGKQTKQLKKMIIYMR